MDCFRILNGKLLSLNNFWLNHFINSIRPGCHNRRSIHAMLIPLWSRHIVCCDNVAFGRIMKRKLALSPDQSDPIVIRNRSVLDKIPGDLISPHWQRAYSHIPDMIVDSCVYSIHVGSTACLVLQEMFQLLNISNLCCMTVRQPSLILIMKPCPSQRYFFRLVDLIKCSPVR